MNDNRWLFLFLRAVPCSYACKHCLFAPEKRFKAMTYAEVTRALQPFVDSLGKVQMVPYRNLAVYLGDCALNFEAFPNVVRFLKTHHIEGWQSVASDGFRRRSFPKWETYLQAMRKAGTEVLEFSLYGLSTTHDWFAGFPGSYQDIQMIAKLWFERGGKVLWSIFVHKRNLEEITVLREELQREYGAESEVVIWDYLGWGAYSEGLRIEVEDLEMLDEASRKALSLLKSESEWIELLQNEERQPFHSELSVVQLSVEKSGDVRVPYTTVNKGLDGEVVGNVFSESVGEVLYRWRRFYTKWADSYPPIGVLCSKYGDGKNKRLYSRQSIIRKWCAAFEAQSQRPTLRAADTASP